MPEQERWIKEVWAQSFTQHFLVSAPDMLRELERQGFVRTLTPEGQARADGDLGVIRALRRHKVNTTVILLTLQDMGFVEEFELGE